MNIHYLSGWRIRRMVIPEGPVWRSLWVVSAAAVFFCLLMEFVFFATKASFMNTLTGWERTRVLLLSPLPLILASAAGCAVFRAAERVAPQARGIWVSIGMLWPGLILASSFLLLLDNFTYTLFRVGVRTTPGFWRYGYVAVFGLFWVSGWRLGMRMLRGLSARRKTGRFAGWLACVLAVSWCILLPWGADRVGGRMLWARELDMGSLPNILLLASDGVSADNLSIYGYERETTPFLRAFARKGALICENAFANAQNSGSSIASMLTGKLPTALRLYYSPEILTGRNAYEHLPGILRQYGYENVDIGLRQFADAYDLNMLHSFQVANGRKEREGWWQNRVSTWLGMDTGYFLGNVWERLQDRLLHAAGVKDFESAYDVVAGGAAAGGAQDQLEIDQLLRLIASRHDRPFFAHVHLMGTHWPVSPRQDPVFSKGRKQPSEQDFYDDAILEFDAAFGRIVRALEAAGQLDNTIIVLFSDHAKVWGWGRTPLVFWFPGGAHAGRIRTNAQNVDIAPTLLDYLEIPRPEWMAGASLLKGEPPERRPVFFTAANCQLVDTKTWLLDGSRLKPPFYSLGVLGMRIGDRAYLLRLDSEDMATYSVLGHTHPLGKGEVMALPEAWETLSSHLEENGYEVPAALKQRVLRDKGRAGGPGTGRS